MAVGDVEKPPPAHDDQETISQRKRRQVEKTTRYSVLAPKNLAMAKLRGLFNEDEESSDMLTKFLDSLKDWFAQCEPICGEKSCNCMCHRGSETPARLVYDLVRAATMLTCIVPMTKDAEVQAMPTTREFSTSPPTAEQTKRMHWVSDAGCQASSIVKAQGTTMLSSVNTTDSSTQMAVRLPPASSGCQTEAKTVKNHGVQATPQKVVYADSEVQANADTIEQGCQAKPPVRQMATQLECGELLVPRHQRRTAKTEVQKRAQTWAAFHQESFERSIQAAERLRMIASSPQFQDPSRLGVQRSPPQASPAPRQGQLQPPQPGGMCPQTPQFGGSPGYVAGEVLHFADQGGRWYDADSPEFGQATPWPYDGYVHREPEPEVQDFDTADPEELIEELTVQQAMNSDSLFLTKSVGIQAGSETADAMTSTAVPSKRAGCQTDTCFIIEKRGRIPVRIGGGYHVLPTDDGSPQPISRFPDAEIACAPPADESTPNMHHVGVGCSRPHSPELGFVSPNEANAPHNQLPVHTINGLIYGERVPDSDRFVHGAATAASDIERFMIGAYGLPPGRDTPPQMRTPPPANEAAGGNVMSGDVGQALLAMYRVMRPKERNAHSPAPAPPLPQVAMTPPATASRPPSAASASSRRTRTARGASKGPGAWQPPESSTPRGDGNHQTPRMDGSAWGWATTLRD